MEVLVSAYRSASLVTKLTGRYDVTDDVASLRGILMPWMRMPLVLVAQGELSITESGMSFRPVPYRLFGWIARSPHKNLSFALSRRDVLSVEAVDFSSPVMRFFDLPFTRIRTVAPTPLNNFLLCVGGRIVMPRIRARSQKLRQSLLTWHTTKSGISA